jgi:hypothetical protein
MGSDPLSTDENRPMHASKPSLFEPVFALFQRLSITSLHFASLHRGIYREISLSM